MAQCTVYLVNFSHEPEKNVYSAAVGWSSLHTSIRSNWLIVVFRSTYYLYILNDFLHNCILIVYYCKSLIIGETVYSVYVLPLQFFCKSKTVLRKTRFIFKTAKKCITVLFVKVKKLKATPISNKEIRK